MNYKKAQTAIEFIILIISALFFIIALSSTFNQKIAQKTIEKRNFVMEELSLTVQNELNIAAKSSDGYRREFDLPSKIVNLDYSITILNSFIYINTSDGKHALAMPSQNATGQFIVGATNVITKTNSTIFIN